jgi:hypothetical protein
VSTDETDLDPAERSDWVRVLDQWTAAARIELRALVDRLTAAEALRVEVDKFLAARGYWPGADDLATHADGPAARAYVESLIVRVQRG